MRSLPGRIKAALTESPARARNRAVAAGCAAALLATVFGGAWAVSGAPSPETSPAAMAMDADARGAADDPVVADGVAKGDGNPVVAAPATKEEEKQESQGNEAADQGQQPQGPTDAGQSGGQQGGSAQGGQTGGGNKTEKPVATPSSSTSSNGSSSTQKPQKTWVEEKGHYEPVYESVWVPNVQYIRHERWECSACGSMFGSQGAMSAHVHDTYGDAQHPNGASAIDQSYTEKVDNGRYEQRQTGQKWVVDVPGHWE
ncbi:hypothetical protein AAK967_06025 [Atopobiaceae bacterium 24-176]